jgi:anti-sigma regulatory factor (Ser/Thr protein kinase)
MGSEKTGAKPTSRIAVEKGSLPDIGGIVLAREIPSDAALVPPLVIRTIEFLAKESLLLPEDENRVGLCLQEALQNAVVHGNKKDFRRKVRLSVFVSESEWGCVVQDEGDGFDPEGVRSPTQPEGLWGESGRGLYIISHYMDRVVFYGGGNTLVMARRL